MKVLHITKWFPTAEEPVTGIFIKRQIESLEPYCSNAIIHLDHYPKNVLCSFKKEVVNNKFYRIKIFTRSQVWAFIEVLYAWSLYRILKSKEAKEADVVNFHIPYPQLTFFHIIKRLTGFNKPHVITVHWSAYHFNFNSPWESKKLERIKNIFRRGIPLIGVSASIIKDVERFSGCTRYRKYVIPNVINTDTFSLRENNRNPYRYLSVNSWQAIKRPFVLLEVFKNLIEKYPQVTLRIGGGGMELEKMKAYVIENHLEKSIVFLGWLTETQVTEEMNRCNAYVFASDYETFSVSCAEALCCGAVIIGPAISSIREYASDEDGVFTKNNAVEALTACLDEFISVNAAQNFDRKGISERARKHFSRQQVGSSYYKALTEVAGGVNHNEKQFVY